MVQNLKEKWDHIKAATHELFVEDFEDPEEQQDNEEKFSRYHKMVDTISQFRREALAK